MKYFRTPDNNPFLAGTLFWLIIFAAALLFFSAMSYLPTDHGLGDGNGQAVFGAGSGDGTGTGEGRGSGPGKNKVGGDDGTDEKDSGGDGGEETQQPPEKEEEPGNRKSDAPPRAPASPASQPRKKTLPPRAFKSAGISDNSAPANKDDENENDDGQSSGPRSFSSGGRSVFRIKRHENALFILDISPSMQAHTKERLTRIQILKLQMKSILESLYKKDSNGYYAIMAFSHTAHIFPVNNRQCRFDSLNDLEAAKKWIDNMDKLPQRYSTRLFMAMENAANLLKHQEFYVDTIYLLTDGETTDISNVQAYIELIQKKMPKNIVIHTISIGRDSPLLKEIARCGKGKYDKYE